MAPGRVQRVDSPGKIALKFGNGAAHIHHADCERLSREPSRLKSLFDSGCYALFFAACCWFSALRGVQVQSIESVPFFLGGQYTNQILATLSE